MNEVKKWYRKHKTDILWIGGGALIGVACSLSYLAGGMNTPARINRGLERTFARHPELERPMIEAVHETYEYYCG